MFFSFCNIPWPHARNYVTALHEGTGMATAWNPGADSAVSAIAVSSGTVYAGGSFRNIGGEFHPYFAQFDSTVGSQWR